jgi:hypothetical protein
LVEAPASAPAEAGEVVGSSARSSWCLIVTGGGGDGRTATAAGVGSSVVGRDDCFGLLERDAGFILARGRSRGGRAVA